MRTITLTGHLLDASGQDASGWVRLAPVDQVLAPDADVVIGLSPVEQKLVAGRFAIGVQTYTDSDSTVPVIVEVHVLLTDARPVSEVLNVQTGGDSVDYADAPRVMLSPSDGSDVPVVPWSAVGQPGGVAPLDTTGRVPTRHLPATSGGDLYIDDLADVDMTGAVNHSVLTLGDDGILRPLPSSQQRGDALFVRAGAPASTDDHDVNDVWIDTTSGQFELLQLQEN